MITNAAALEDYGTSAIRNDLWKLLITSMSSPEVEGWSAKEIGNTVQSVKVLLDFLHGLETKD